MTKPMDTVAPFKEIIDEFKEAGAISCSLCYQCGKCDVVCPWNRVKDYSMRRVVREASLGLAEIEGEDIWTCTTCGTCPDNCPRGVGQIETAVSLRKVASEYGVFPGSVKAIRAVRGSLTADGNPLQEERANRDNWAEGLAVPKFKEGMEVLYFVGCYYSYDPRMKKAAVATAKILKQAGVDFGILGSKESCCGESIRKTGGEEAFRSLAKENIKTFIDKGVKKILVASPHCYETFVKEYPEFMVNFEVVHMTEFLMGLLAEGRLKLKGDFAKKVTYHDPCYLGRHNNIYDAPRDILKQIPGLDLVEMRDHRENSLCCGGGGGRIWADTHKDERFSDLRLAQAEEVGAQVLVTSCPYCITHFEEARLNLADDAELEVKDITEVIHELIQD